MMMVPGLCFVRLTSEVGTTMICSLIRPSSSPPYNSHTTMVADNIGALIIKIGFWGPLYYMYCKERPPPKKKIVQVIITAPKKNV